MSTNHIIHIQPAQDMGNIDAESIALVVTSPPYPMIQMWDETLGTQNKKVKKNIKNEQGNEAFDLMHGELDKIWNQIYQILIPGGIVCINIGDATRTMNGVFRLYPNHAKIIQTMISLGFQSLPGIIWRKPTNSPTKFMGSGMYPPGAYVTLEHEYILIFRKGDKREFLSKDLEGNRRESAFFWEERNVWFSDLWEIKGVGQKNSNNAARERTGAFPFEIASRLINMFSIKGDTVLDPFLGTGTTTCAAIASERNSIGIEIDPDLGDIIENKILDSKAESNRLIDERLKKHNEFILKREAEQKEIKYVNEIHQFKVITRQEKLLKIRKVKKIEKKSTLHFIAEYEDV